MADLDQVADLSAGFAISWQKFDAVNLPMRATYHSSVRCLIMTDSVFIFYDAGYMVHGAGTGDKFFGNLPDLQDLKYHLFHDIYSFNIHKFPDPLDGKLPSVT